ncbi:DUF1508 domain-containing protein [Halobacteriales archaeon QS_1_68_20]|nr:MAG: DUF1508 domain-containing protein [Halobacteriales archaeon QS_1_68_20]
MSTSDIEGGQLFQLYARYVGEPESKKDVWGYWLFLIGAVVSFVGVALFLTLAEGPVGANFLFRGLSLTLAAAGLPLGLLGIVLLLPLKRFSAWLTILGALVALGAVVFFAYAYPEHWPPINDNAVNYRNQIIATYSGGIGLMVLIAVLVPIITGEKSLFLSPEYEREDEHPPVVVGESIRGGMFSVYRDGKDWTWRLIDQEAIAGSVDSYVSKLETEESVDRIKTKVKEAGLLEIKHAAFRLYEAAEDSWKWVLMSEAGSIVAESDEEYGSRDDAAESVNDLKEFGPDAEIIDIEGDGAFQIHEEGGEYRWRLVDEDRNVVAEGPHGIKTYGDAAEGTEIAKGLAEDARTLAVETLGVELFEKDGSWHWRLVDADDQELATSESGYTEQRVAEEQVYDLLEDVANAPLLDAEDPSFEITPAEDGWEWRLVDEDGDVYARSAATANAPGPAENTATTVRDNARDAEVVSIQNADFEYYPTDDGWRWRLVTEDREVLATSVETFDSSEAAAETVDKAQAQAQEAELREFEGAAFKLYEVGDEWRWRLIDEDGNVMADSGEEHDSRDSAAASMMTIKEQAPDADVLEVEAAAFELFHDEDENWNWRLIDEGGETTARGPEMLPSEQAAREAMDRVADAADGDARKMGEAVYQVYAVDDDWTWQFVLPDGSVVAEGEDVYGTRDEAVSTIESVVREVAASASIDTIEELALQLTASGDRHSWRIIEPGRNVVASSSRAYGNRDDAIAEVETVRDHAADATVFELQAATFQLRGADDGWTWRLIDDERETIMQSPGSYETSEDAEAAIEEVRDVIRTADILDYDEAAFELVEREDHWTWRLIDEEGNSLASSENDYSNREDAKEALESVRRELHDASILEIDIAAFELQEADGLWRWRLIDENGNAIAQSLRTFDSRREARESMEMLKEHAPQAMTTVAE